MSILIIGADHLGTIPAKLKGYGATSIFHITGRKPREWKPDILQGVDMIIILYDYVNHDLARKIKKSVKREDIPIIFAKRSWTSIEEKLKKTMGLKGRKAIRSSLPSYTREGVRNWKGGFDN